MTPTPYQLREIAQAMDDLANMECAPVAEKPEQMHIAVTWPWGGACNGHKELQRAVTRLVEQAIFGLCQRAITEQRDRVATLHELLRAPQEERGV